MRDRNEGRTPNRGIFFETRRGEPVGCGVWDPPTPERKPTPSGEPVLGRV